MCGLTLFTDVTTSTYQNEMQSENKKLAKKLNLTKNEIQNKTMKFRETLKRIRKGIQNDTPKNVIMNFESSCYRRILL